MPPSGNFHDVAGLELFSAPSFDGSIQLDVAALDQHLGVAAGGDDPSLFEKLIETNGFILASFHEGDLLCG